MTDDIRVDSGSPVDLLIVGGLTIDLFEGGEVVGGAARYSTEAALAAGLRVGLLTAAAEEPLIQTWLAAVGERAKVVRHPASSTIVYEHHGHHADRRLRLRRGTDPMRIPNPERLPAAAAVLFAPVADEVSVEALRAVDAPLRAAGLQGWLRMTNDDGWVERRPLSTVSEDVAEALRELDLLQASIDELRGDDGHEAVGRLRRWAGPGPELVVTAGVNGAWVDDGGAPRHVPAEPVENAHTVGAGDAFAAVLVARRGAGNTLFESAEDAARATARYLASRPGPDYRPVDESPIPPTLDATSWRAVRFGPDLASTPPDGAEFSLLIEAGRLSGRSGCNRFMGTWSAVEGRLAIGPLASTMMYCDGLMELEAAFLAALQGATAASVVGDRLLLTGPDGAPTVELHAAAPEAPPAN